MKKIILLSSLLFLSSCGEEISPICKSFCESRGIDKKDYKYYSVYKHIVTFRENISIDIIFDKKNYNESYTTEIKKFYLNNKLVCEFSEPYYTLNVRNLDLMVSYTLEEAYNNSILDDNDVDNLIQECIQLGYCPEKSEE